VFVLPGNLRHSFLVDRFAKVRSKLAPKADGTSRRIPM